MISNEAVIYRNFCVSVLLSGVGRGWDAPEGATQTDGTLGSGGMILGGFVVIAVIAAILGVASLAR